MHRAPDFILERNPKLFRVLRVAGQRSGGGAREARETGETPPAWST